MPLTQTVTVVSGAVRSSVMGGGVQYLTLTTPGTITTVSATGTLHFYAQTGSTYRAIETSGGTAISIVAASGASEFHVLSDQLTKALRGCSAWRVLITKTGSATAVSQAQDTALTFGIAKYS